MITATLFFLLMMSLLFPDIAPGREAINNGEVVAGWHNTTGYAGFLFNHAEASDGSESPRKAENEAEESDQMPEEMEVAPRVGKITFEGNDTYASLVLERRLELEAPSIFDRLKFWDKSGFEFDETGLRRDEIRIKRFYQRRGFPGVTVRSQIKEGKKKGSLNILFIIEEGDPIIIETFEYEIIAGEDDSGHLQNHRDYLRAMERHPMQAGQRYQLVQHSEVEGLFLSVMHNTGFAFAEARLTARVDTLQRKANITLILDTGPIASYGKIQVEGNETVTEAMVLRQSELVTGNQYSSKELRESRQQIFGHPLFRFVTVGTVPQPRDSIVDITIRVREYALRSLRVQAGVSLEEIARLNLSWEHRNPFGNANGFSVTTRASFLEQRANLDYHIPYVFNPKSRINISPFGQRLDEKGYLLYRGGITNTFIYRINTELTTTFSYEFTRNREQIRITDIRFFEEDELYNISALRLSAFFSKPDIEHAEGWMIHPRAEFSGFLGTGTLRYNRYILDIRRYVNITENSRFAIRAEGGRITFTGLETLPSNIRLYSGGSTSVRGWQRRELGPKRALLDENDQFSRYVPVGGKASGHFNVEWRQRLDKLIRRFGMVLFLDGGAVWEDWDDAHPEDLQFALGGGFRYYSPIGPVRLDIARKLNPADEDLNIYEGVNYGSWFDYWGVHFSIGHAF